MCKLTSGAIIRVDGWVLLKSIDAGLWQVKKITQVHGRAVYWLGRPKSAKAKIGHYAESVDCWVRPEGDEDLNKITLVNPAHV